jgi:hypothetical protein
MCLRTDPSARLSGVWVRTEQDHDAGRSALEHDMRRHCIPTCVCCSEYEQVELSRIHWSVGIVEIGRFLTRPKDRDG